MKNIIVSFILIVSITLMSVYASDFKEILSQDSKSVSEINSHTFPFIAFEVNQSIGEDDLPMPLLVSGEDDLPAPF
jgi:hypothetical protein